MATKVIDANAIVSHAKPLMNQRSCEIRESGHSVDPLARCLALLDELREKMEQEFAALLTIPGSQPSTRAWRTSVGKGRSYK